MSDIQGLLDAMAAEPERFKQTTYTFDDKLTGAEYWTANGFWFYGMYVPSRYEFSFLDKFRFAHALRKWRAGYLHYLNNKSVEFSSGQPRSPNEGK